MPAPTVPLGVFQMRATDRRDPSIDFAKDIPAGDGIQTATAALWRLDTAPPTSVGAPTLSGSPTATGTVVKQMVANPLAGLTYQLDLSVQTTQGREATESILIVVGYP